MKKLFLVLLAAISLQFVFAQSAITDTVKVKYFLTPAKDYQEDVMPRFNLSVIVNNKKTNLKLMVMENSPAGEIEPEILVNTKAKRTEYLLKTWFAGGGINVKAWVTGSRKAKNLSLVVYRQDVDEQAPASKWKLIKTIRL